MRLLLRNVCRDGLHFPTGYVLSSTGRSVDASVYPAQAIRRSEYNHRNRNITTRNWNTDASVYLGLSVGFRFVECIFCLVMCDELARNVKIFFITFHKAVGWCLKICHHKLLETYLRIVKRKLKY